MLLRKRFVVLVLASSQLLISGCGGEELLFEPTASPSPGQAEGSKRSALQSVVAEITLPSSGLEHGLDLDHDGVVDNQVGRILEQLRALLGIEMQPTLDQQLADGKAILLYDILARSLVDDGQAQVLAYLGVDLDGDPSDNLSGTEPFLVQRQIAASSPLPAAITSGRLSSTKPGPGIVSFPFPTNTAVLRLHGTRIEADVGTDGMSRGILAGAIPTEQMMTSLAPVIAAEANRLYTEPEQDPATRRLLGLFLDLDRDGAISVEELMSSAAFGLLLHAADLDTDGDGQPDALSFGISFRSVPCTIEPSH